MAGFVEKCLCMNLKRDFMCQIFALVVECAGTRPEFNNVYASIILDHEYVFHSLSTTLKEAILLVFPDIAEYFVLSVSD